MQVNALTNEERESLPVLSPNEIDITSVHRGEGFSQADSTDI